MSFFVVLTSVYCCAGPSRNSLLFWMVGVEFQLMSEVFCCDMTCFLFVSTARTQIKSIFHLNTFLWYVWICSRVGWLVLLLTFLLGGLKAEQAFSAKLSSSFLRCHGQPPIVRIRLCAASTMIKALSSHSSHIHEQSQFFIWPVHTMKIERPIFAQVSIHLIAGDRRNAKRGLLVGRCCKTLASASVRGAEKQRHRIRALLSNGQWLQRESSNSAKVTEKTGWDCTVKTSRLDRGPWWQIACRLREICEMETKQLGRVSALCTYPIKSTYALHTNQVECTEIGFYLPEVKLYDR